jgi:hypothetical protein
MSAKRKWREWYHWVKGIHVDTVDEEWNIKWNTKT